MKTLTFILGAEEDIKVGNEYYFGQRGYEKFLQIFRKKINRQTTDFIN